MVYLGRIYRIFIRHRFLSMLLLLVFIAHSVLYIHIYRNFPDVGHSFDKQYVNISEHLYRYGAYSAGERDQTGNLTPTLSEPPLYVLLYAASFKIWGVNRAAHETMRIFQMLLNLGVIFVSWRLGRIFSEQTGKIAAAFAAFDLSAFYFAQNFMIPDTTLGFFMALWLLYLVKFLKQESSYKNMLLSSLFLGLAMWTKVAVFMLWVPLAFFLIVFLWHHRSIILQKKISFFAVFAVAVLIFFGGWKVRNYWATGYGVYSSGITPLFWNAFHLIAYQEGISRPEAAKKLNEQYITQTVLQMDEGTRERYLTKEMLRLIVHSPFDFTVVALQAMPGMFLGTFPPYILFGETEASEVIDRVKKAAGNRTLLSTFWQEGRQAYVFIYAAAKLHLILMYAVAAVAAILFVRDKSLRWIIIAMALTVAYTIAVSGAAAQARYRTIVFPIFYTLAGYGAASVLAMIKTRRMMVRNIPH